MAVVALAATLACKGSGTRIDAPPPSVHAGVGLDTAQLAAVPPSEVSAPVSYDLAPGLAWFESVVPRRIGDLNRRLRTSNKRLEIAFELTRGPFALTVSGRTATLASVLSYRGRGWYHPPLLPAISASCGTGDLRPRVRVAIASTVDVTPQWTLVPRTRVVTLRPLTPVERDQCEITAANIDVTDKVIEAARKAMEGELAKLDRQIRAFDLATQVADIWQTLQAPLSVTDSVWLLINPLAVRLGPFYMDRKVLRATLGLRAQPRVVTGPRPVVAGMRLPALVDSMTAGGLNVLLEGRLRYDVASDILRTKLRDKRITVAGQTLRLRDLEASGVGDGRLALRLDVTGDVTGTLYVVGTPKYDPAREELHMPDLAYDIATDNLLGQGLAWLKGDELLAWLRANARLPAGRLLDEVRHLAEREMNRELTRGVNLQARLDSGRVLSVTAAPTALRVQAAAGGHARLTITLYPVDSVPNRVRSPRAGTNHRP